MNFTEVDKLIMELSSGQDPTDEEVVEVYKIIIGKFLNFFS